MSDNKVEMTMTAGYGRDRLDRVFRLVQNPHDWRARINSVVDVSHPDIGGDLSVIFEAVSFFTGTNASIVALGGTKFRCMALGYRNGPCGP